MIKFEQLFRRFLIKSLIGFVASGWTAKNRAYTHFCVMKMFEIQIGRFDIAIMINIWVFPLGDGKYDFDICYSGGPSFFSYYKWIVCWWRKFKTRTYIRTTIIFHFMKIVVILVFSTVKYETIDIWCFCRAIGCSSLSSSIWLFHMVRISFCIYIFLFPLYLCACLCTDCCDSDSWPFAGCSYYLAEPQAITNNLNLAKKRYAKSRCE